MIPGATSKSHISGGPLIVQLVGQRAVERNKGQEEAMVGRSLRTTALDNMFRLLLFPIVIITFFKKIVIKVIWSQ